MHHPQRLRRASDLAHAIPSRCYPQAHNSPHGQPLSPHETGNAMNMQYLHSRSPGNLVVMCHEEQCSQKPPHETTMNGHARPHSQYQHSKGKFNCCDAVPHPNLPLRLSHTNQQKMDGYSFFSKQSFGFRSCQPASMFHTAGQRPAYSPYNPQSPFASNDQITMASPYTNSGRGGDLDFASQTSTSCESYSPSSIFSAIQQAGGNGNGSQYTPGTPTTSVSGSEQVLDATQKISPAHNATEVMQDTAAAARSERYGPNAVLNVDDDLLADGHCHGHAQATSRGVEQHNVAFLDNVPDALSPEEALIIKNSASKHQLESLLPTATSFDHDPVLGNQQFAPASSFEDLDNQFYHRQDVSSFGADPSAYAFSSFGSQYQPTTFDFNQPITSDYSTTGYPVAPIPLPSNGCSAADNLSNSGSSGRARNGNRNGELDRKLVQWRQEGLSYKEIMVRGNFGLEESTLRGRYRTLTKKKEERLRKPAWDTHSLSTLSHLGLQLLTLIKEKALIDGVEAEAPPSAKRPRTTDALAKVPWKKVALWMAENRGCYKYGNATVKKKYIELLTKERKTGSVASLAGIL